MNSRLDSCLIIRCIFTAFLLSAIGCVDQQENVYTEYGKIRGKSAGTSVNGVSVLADMLREQGHSVSRYGRLSPKIERYETLIWFPSNKNCPSDEAVARLEEWIDNGYRRTLIYVGYDFAGEVDYYRRVVSQTQGEQKERAMRALAEALMQDDARLYDDLSYDWRVNFVGGKPADNRCRWFDLEIDSRKTSNDLDGPLAESLDPESLPEIQTRALLNPRDSYQDIYPDRSFESLLTVEGRPFAFRYHEQPADDNQYWATENQLIFVTNAHFLANYGLTEAENRELAKNLIDHIDPYSDVLFLESDERGIEVSESDYDAHNTWSWITQKPLCYMVPHFLAWGILFCFTFYPIFGRPKRIANDRNRSFGDHIAAIARLSGRHESLKTAKAKVRNYLDADENASGRKQVLTKSSDENVVR
jgi:hypothetical protein